MTTNKKAADPGTGVAAYKNTHYATNISPIDRLLPRLDSERSVAIVKNCQSQVSEVSQVAFDNLAEWFAEPKIGAKDGEGWLPAKIEVGPRTGERVESISFLALDVEADAKPVKDENGEHLRDPHGDIVKHVQGQEPPDVDTMLAECFLHGWRCVLHTSYSHGGAIRPEGIEHPRYRLIFDLSRPLKPAELKTLGLHVAGLLGIGDCFDSKCLEPARLFYMPRCPSEERRRQYRHAVSDGEPLPVDELLDEARRIEVAQKKTSRHPPASTSVIDAFNAQADIGNILEENGYTPKERRRWLWAGSTTGLPGVRMLPDDGRGKRVFSSHGDDPLNDSHAHDAFDCFRILRHGGDMSAAVKAAAEVVGRTIANAKAPEMASHQPEQENAAASLLAGQVWSEEFEAVHVNQPRPAEAMLYGLAGEIGKTAAATTEANPYAVCMGFLSFLSAMAGRDVYLPVGNTRHHARLFTLHVGRSSRGRKGDALSLVHRIRHTIDRREHDRGTVGGSLLGQVHTGGLSSREGLVMFIHDGFRQGKDEIPAIDDKRLWVVESEFANVLQQAKRDGNTLSSALRDAWDGVSIKPATKTARTWATDPHIGLAGAITPTELCEMMKARELSNGFANRFLIFWAERDRLVPFPTATDGETLSQLVARTEDVLRFMRGNYPAESDTRKMDMNQAAQDAYERLYRGDLNKGTGSVKLDGILERRAPMLLRLSMLFALSDLSLTIDAHHIEAARAWVAYWTDSVRYIFKEAAAGEVDAERLAEASAKLLQYLGANGEADRKEITNVCFGKRAPSGGLDAVIAELLNSTPPKIEAVALPRRDGLVGKGRTIYRTLVSSTPADLADVADIGVNTGSSSDSSTPDIDGLRVGVGQAAKAESAMSALSPHGADLGETRMDKQSPLSPQPPGDEIARLQENPGAVEVEI